MLIIPAIDLQGGCVVRFTQGRFDKKIYSRDPLKTAKHWVRQGAEYLHVVDLDGAFSGVARNLTQVREIVSNVDVPVEFGGGLRDIAAIKKILQFGVSRVVLGTKAVEDKRFLERVFSLFRERVIISLDAKDEVLQVKGWRKNAGNIKVLDFAQYLAKKGFEELIYTDTLKDGTLKGPNIKTIKALLKETHLKVIASGGISSLEDVRKLKSFQNLGVSGIIIGKALYEGKFTLPQALKVA